MRIYKYFFFAIVSLFCAVITTSQFIDLAAYDHCGYPCVQMMFSPENSDFVFNTISKLETKYDVNVFIPDVYNKDKSEIDCVFYADDASKKALESEAFFSQGNYRSGIFSGEYTFHFRIRPLSEAKGEVRYMHDIRLIGKSSSVSGFADEFVMLIKENYADKYKCYYDGRSTGAKDIVLRNIILTWSAGLAIMLVIVIFETAILRKEALVSLIGGNSIGAFIAKRLIKDIAGYTAVLSLVFVVLYILGTPAVSFAFSLVHLAALILLSLVVYLTLYLSNIKKALGGVKQGTRILYFNYFLKIIAVFVCFIILGELIGITQDTKAERDTSEVLDKYFGDYYYVDEAAGYQAAGKLDENDPARIKYIIHRDHYDDMKPLLLSCRTSEDGTRYVNANRYAMDYLCSVIPELDDCDRSKEFIILCRKDDDAAMSKLMSTAKSYEHIYGVKPQQIFYDRSVSVMGLKQDTITAVDFVKDPIVVITLARPEFFESRNIDNESHCALLMDSKKTDELCAQYGLSKKDLAVCSVKDTFQRQWGVGKAAIASQITLEAVMLFVVMLISFSILKFTFITKAKELCIKRIFGHGFLSRYYPTFLLSISVYIPGLIYALDRDKKASFGANTGLITAFTLGVMAVDLLVSMPYIFKTEKANVSKVLKGGAL